MDPKPTRILLRNVLPEEKSAHSGTRCTLPSFRHPTHVRDSFRIRREAASPDRSLPSNLGGPRFLISDNPTRRRTFSDQSEIRFLPFKLSSDREVFNLLIEEGRGIHTLAQTYTYKQVLIIISYNGLSTAYFKWRVHSLSRLIKLHTRIPQGSPSGANYQIRNSI